MRSWSSRMSWVCCRTDVAHGRADRRPRDRHGVSGLPRSAKEATVLFSGVGGDEIFAGYRKHVAHGWAESIRRVPGFAPRRSQGALCASGTTRHGFQRRVAFGEEDGTLRRAQPRRSLYSQLHLSRRVPETRFVRSGVSRRRRRIVRSSLAPSAAFHQVQHADFLNQMLYLDTKIFMPTLNLTYNDKMSMASSVEVRVPFLDRALR